MKYSRDDHRIQIGIDELEKLLNDAKQQNKYNNMVSAVIIQLEGTRPEILQLCCYGDCFPVDHSRGFEIKSF